MAWTVEAAGQTLAAFVKSQTGAAWSVTKRQVTGGKVFVDGACITQIDHRLTTGQQVELRTNAPKPRDPTREGELDYDDTHVVVIDKPQGVTACRTRSASSAPRWT